MRRADWPGSAAVLLGAFLLLSGGAKYLAPDRLQAALIGQAPFGLLAAGLLAVLVPSIELVAGAALLLPAWRRTALPIAAALLAALLAWKCALLLRGFTGDCGCLGLLAAWPARVTVWIDAGLLVLALTLWRDARRSSVPA